MAWPTTTYNNVEYYLFDGIILIPVDPSMGFAQLLLKPNGLAVGVGIPAIEQGEPGETPEISTTINNTVLEHDDVTPDSMSWTETSPGVYQLNATQRKGPPGDDSSVEIDLDTVGGTAATGKMIVVNSTADGFDFQHQKIGDRHIPATISTTVTAGNATLATVSIPAQNFDYRPRCHGYTVVTGTGTNVRVDLYARLNGETGGNIIAKCSGIDSTERLTLAPGPPAGSADAFDKVTAGNSATVHLRAERQSGSDSYAVSASTTVFSVEVQPVP